jgi:hypothetical protein
MAVIWIYAPVEGEEQHDQFYHELKKTSQQNKKVRCLLSWEILMPGWEI